VLRKLLGQPRAWLDALLAPAQDPRQGGVSPAERHRLLLDQLRHSLAAVSASKIRLGARAAEAEAHLPELAVRARQAVAAGRLDLARAALRRRQAAALNLAQLRRQVEELEGEEARLTLVEQRVTAAVEAYHTKHELAQAKYTAAAAQIRVGEALAGVSDELGDLGAGLSLAEERAERMEARATAIDRLVSEGALEGPPPALDEQSDAAVEAELAALLTEKQARSS